MCGIIKKYVKSINSVNNPITQPRVVDTPRV